MAEIQYYEAEDGSRPFLEWFEGLDPAVQNRVATAVARFELDNFGDSKGVGEGVMERRLTFGPGYRVYYGREAGRVVILLTGGTKKRQQRDIERAKRLWFEYLRRSEEDDEQQEEEAR